MPQVVVDLETLVCGGDNRIACETILDQDSDPDDQNQHNHHLNAPDFPAESYYLSKEDELDWIDRNAYSSLFDRKDSTKTNRNSTTTNSNSNSQRFSFTLKSKSSIIGLPKPHNNSSCFVRRSTKPSTARFFPKRSGSSGKSVTEPSSPKVSCIGRVRSKKVRNRRCRSIRRRHDEKSPAPKKTSGFWSSFRDALRFGCRKTQGVKVVERSEAVSPARKVSSATEKRKSSPSEPVVEPPALSGMNRFASGRRSDSWAGDVVDVKEVECDSVDRGLRSGGPTEPC